MDLTILGELPTSAAGIVYRVVQESLTNVVRHAPGADVHVSIPRTRRASWCMSSTTVRAPDGVGGSRGYGLIGLAERVGFAGGTLQSGSGPEGIGFSVEAVLPVRVDEVTS